ncbi:hypothetical protein [Trinickia mobilis]|uniref:hypothetical protein n=1 Tax=Trinickia mobilis TaxID=2816356 RepID=UPI001A903941|nr:hypothetical protein [Trinickia mobilis]
MKPTSEDVTPESARADSTSASARERAPSKGHGPYTVIVLVLPVMIAALFITLGVFGLLVRLFSR